MTTAILQVKSRLGLKWKTFATAAGLSPMFVTSACLGMNSLAPEPADRVAAALDLGPKISAALQAFPHKQWDQAIPTDPVIYRFYEMIHVYGDTLKGSSTRSSAMASCPPLISPCTSPASRTRKATG